MASIRFGSKVIKLPASRLARVALGVLLVIGGILGFLPILGFWMIPLGLGVLSIDIPAIRRWRRRVTVRFGLWIERRFPRLARRLGFAGGRRERLNGSK